MAESGPTDDDVKGFREKYPNLRFELGKVEDLKARYVEISGLEAEEEKKKTKLVFGDTKVLAETLDTTSGLVELRFLEPELGIAVGDSVCVLVTGLRKHTYEWFMCNFMEQRFDTYLGRTESGDFGPFRPLMTLERYRSSPRTDYQLAQIDSTYFRKVLDQSSEELFDSLALGAFTHGLMKDDAPLMKLKDKESDARQLALASSNLLTSVVRSQEDLARALVNTRWPLGGNEYIAISGPSGSRGTLDRSWRELLDWAQLEYYTIHGALPSPMREWPRSHYFDSAVSKPASKEKDTPTKPRTMSYCRVRHEPLGYIRVAEASTLPAFTYLSLYHVLEYFFDDVVYAGLQSEIRKVLSSPRLESNKDKYAIAIADIVERFSSPLRDDREKLKLTLRNFIPFSTLKDDTPAEVLETIRKSVKFEGGLKLDSVNLDDEDKFFGDLAARVHIMRNAIVHSKHAESEVRGSYDPGGKDTGRVEKESEMLKHFVLEVMFRSGSLS